MSALTLRQLLEEQFFPCSLSIKNKKTKDHYRRAIGRFQEFLKREPLVSDLDDEHLRSHLHWLLTVVGQSPETVNCHRKNLLALARWCVIEHMLDRAPRVGKLQTPEETPEAWSQEELERLIRAGVTSPGIVAGVAASVWWRAAFALELQTAARCGELLALEWAWLTQDGRLRVPSSVRKGGLRGAAYRLEGWSLASLADLASLQGNASRPIGRILGDTDPTTVYKHFDSLLKRAGLPGGRKNKWHKLRRTVATLVVIGGGNPTSALRNESESVTWKHYVDQSQTAEPLGKYLPTKVVGQLSVGPTDRELQTPRAETVAISFALSHG